MTAIKKLDNHVLTCLILVDLKPPRQYMDVQFLRQWNPWIQKSSSEFLIFSAGTDNGRQFDEELCRKLLLLSAKIQNHAFTTIPDFSAFRQFDIQNRIKQVEERNGKFFDEEVLKLDRWSDDLKQGLEREIKDLDKEIREARRATVLAASLHDKLEAQKSIKPIEATKNRKRRELFDAQDAIDSQREELIARIEMQLQQRHSSKPVFTFRWKIVCLVDYRHEVVSANMR